MEERRSAIAELVEREGTVSFTQLKEAFPDVSEMTLRTDLKALDQDRRIVRIHGGAKSVGIVAGTDGLLGRRAQRNVTEKWEIAQKALTLLHPGDTFYLDSGSTAAALARCLPDEPYQIYTSAIHCIEPLARLARPRICLAGGTLNRYSMSVCGSQSMEALRHVNFDLMFLGVTTYSPDAGFCCGVEDETLLKRAVMARSARVAALMDTSKLGRRSSFTICELDEIDILISDGGLPEDFQEVCRHHNVTIL